MKKAGKREGERVRARMRGRNKKKREKGGEPRHAQKGQRCKNTKTDSALPCLRNVLLVSHLHGCDVHVSVDVFFGD